MKGFQKAGRLSLLAIAASLSAAPAGSFSSIPIGAVPASLHLDPFYSKYTDAGGVAIVGSARVPNDALLIARDIVRALLAHRRDLRRELVRRGTRVAVMAAEEGMTDLPEHRHWKKPALNDPRLTACERERYPEIEAMSDREYWNRRARGSGGFFTTVGAENLLATPGARYFGENILVHEFGHAILYAIERADPPLHARIRRAYDEAKAAGLWEGEYAAVTIDEYWAEGSQIWFNTAMIARPRGVEILSPEDLKRYDPKLHSALAEVYGPRHRIAADRFHKHPARRAVPVAWQSADCEGYLG
jgi:hypothetical protein